MATFKLHFWMITIIMMGGAFGVSADAEEVPRTLFPINGQNTVLPCGGFSVLKLGNNITWFWDGQALTSYRTDNENLGAHKLEVVDTDDSGIFLCRFTTNDGPAKDHGINLEVIVAPLNVSIRTDNNDDFEAGIPRVLACVVYGGVPPPNVTWYLGDTMLRPNVYKEVNRGNFTVSSLTFVPSLFDNGKELVCKATNEVQGQIFEDRVVVSVGHRPMCIDNGFKTIGAVDGESETVVCMVESEPDPEQFVWTFADGRTIYTSSKRVSGYDNRYTSTLVWVPRQDDFGPLYCRASNRFGEQKLPCTFSVIIGGPPTTPECEMLWANLTTLKVQCDKNWDGGRPQTIHLEVKGPNGIRKVTGKGLELLVNSLNARENITAELYASNNRGKSSTIRLDLLSGLRLESALEETPYTSKISESSLIIIYSTCGIFSAVIGGYLLYELIACIQLKIIKACKNYNCGTNNFDISNVVPSTNALSPQNCSPSGCRTSHAKVACSISLDCQDYSGHLTQYPIDFENIDVSGDIEDSGIALSTDYYCV